MVNPVRGHPEDRAALKRHGSAGGEEVFDPLGSLVAAMREQAMVGHADADVNCEEVHDRGDGEVGPGKEEESSDGSDVEDRHGDGGDPVDAAFLVFASHAKVFADFFLGCGYCGKGRPGGDCGVFCDDLFGGDYGGAHCCSAFPLVLLIKR